MKKRILRWTPAALFVAAAVLFLVLFIRYQRKPEIFALGSAAAGRGDHVEITGRHFGSPDEGGRIYFGSVPVTSMNILEWTDTKIITRAPRSDGAVLIKVKTRSGTSNGMVLGDAARFPAIDFGPWFPGAPYVEYAAPSSGGPGTLVTLNGKGFGSRMGSGEILMNRSDTNSPMGFEDPNLDLYMRVTEIEYWSDSRIRFRIPETAVSGNLYLRRSGRFSNSTEFRILGGPGRFNLGTGTRWSLRQDVSFNRIGSFPGNSLYVYVPSPQPGPGQGRPVTVEPTTPGAPTPLRRRDGLALYKMEELAPSGLPVISRQLIVSAFPVRAIVNPSLIAPFDPDNPVLRDALGNTDIIRPNQFPRTAAQIVQNRADIWSRAEAVYTYTMERLNRMDNQPDTPVLDDFADRIANSRGYSLLFCSLARSVNIPSRPVAGLIIQADNSTRLWWWAEFWVEGLGWVPVDPALGDSSGKLVLPGVVGDIPRYYFGGLEGRHIAFSRGLRSVPSLQPNPDVRLPENPYSLQSVWEEVSGNLESYASHWPVPRVIASYPLNN